MYHYPLTEQVKSQANMVAELKAFRRQELTFKRPLMDYWFVVEVQGEYSYDILSVSITFGTGVIQFKQIKEVKDNMEYQAFFDTRSST